jgi:hypothetical protein
LAVSRILGGFGAYTSIAWALVSLGYAIALYRTPLPGDLISYSLVMVGLVAVMGSASAVNTIIQMVQGAIAVFLKVWYAGVRESVEVKTDSNRVVQTQTSRWVFTYLKAAFRAVIGTSTDVIERWFTVGSRLWTLALVVSFSAMLSSMVYVLRRGVW